MNRRLAVIAALGLLAVALLAVTCRRNTPPNEMNQDNRLRVEVNSAGSAPAAGGRSLLGIRLSAGAPLPQAGDRTPVTAGEPLAANLLQALLARLPALPGGEALASDFNLPPAGPPPPLTGETIEVAFPPAEEIAPVELVVSGPLAVLRYAPDGDVPLAPFVSVTFNQPMVALGTVAQVSAAEVPVRLTPAIAGRWEWLGTRTVRFVADSAVDRLPMATEFVVEVPAGTRSLAGSALANAVRWTFTTPPPTVVSYYPPENAIMPLEPLFFVAFDQQIEPAAVLPALGLTANGGSVGLRLATEAEIAANQTINNFIAGAQAGRWLVVRPESALPADAALVWTIGPGVPSAEGPRPSTDGTRVALRTYAPLRVERAECGWGDRECPPGTPLRIVFNNPLDGLAFREDQIAIDPPLPGGVAGIEYDSILINGNTRANTEYVVTLAADVADLFGQTLGSVQTARFRVGAPQPLLFGPDRAIVTLDPAATTPALSVYSIGIDQLTVEAYRVTPADWPAYQRWRQTYHGDAGRPATPGERVLQTTVRVAGDTNSLSETSIDLTTAFGGATGHLIVRVLPPQTLFDRDSYRPVIETWLQATQIGIDATSDSTRLQIWTTALRDGAPLAGIQVQLVGSNARVTTGADGLATVDLDRSTVNYLVAERDGDSAILPRYDSYWTEGGWQRSELRDRVLWYVFDDRQIYRPGETVHVKGWLRRIGAGPTGDISLLDLGDARVRYTVYDPQYNEIGRGTAAPNALGGFDLTIDLPIEINLGYATLDLQLENAPRNVDVGGYGHGFQIQEFRRPEFEVAARNESPGPYLAGGEAIVAVSASYYAGGGLPNADVTWTVSATPGSYSPPNWDGFTFGRWTPWWYVYDYGYADLFGRPSTWPGQETAVETFSGVTDAGGTHYLRLEFEQRETPEPVSLRAEATVIDVNRQAWASTTTLLVHPAARYVGLRSARAFVERGDPLPIDAIVTDIDGNAVAGVPFEIVAERLVWRYGAGAWREETAETQRCAITSAAEPVNCTFTTAEGGEYRITARVQDDAGRFNESQLTRWVSGGAAPAARNVEQEQVTLIPDRETYRPGDVAEILVQAPWSPAEGLLTIGREGIVRSERFRIDGTTHVLRVPIRAAHMPDITLRVDLVGAAQRTDDDGNPLPGVPARPAYASGQLTLAVPPTERALTLTVVPAEPAVAPGVQTAVDVTVVDAAGQPVANAELAVVVVDEAILALTNYQLTDPLAHFYATRGSGLDVTHGRAAIVLANPQLLQAGSGAAPLPLATMTAQTANVQREAYAEVDMAVEMPAAESAEESAGADGSAEPIALRSDFNPLATFVPTVATDGAGRARIDVPLPDNLTRYRIMVVAVSGGTQFGKGEANLTARLPLMVRPSLPRFLNFGDNVELPVVIQNQTDAALAVQVAVRAANLELRADAGRLVTVPANDRIELRFPATTIAAGTAQVQVVAASGDLADAALLSLPVYTPATAEAFATYGVLDDGAIVQPVLAPADVFPQFGGLEIGTSSTALQALTDAVIYLVDYPFDSAEQLASRIVAVAALRDVLTAFNAEQLPPPAELTALVQHDIERLAQLQNGDGGFAIWQRGRETDPYISVHAVHALARAQAAGYDVPRDALINGTAYLRDVERSYPTWYGPGVRDSVSAYALATRRLLNDGDAAKASRLLNEGGGLARLAPEALAWLWPTLADDGGYAADVAAIERHLSNRVTETAGAATFTTSYGEQGYLLLYSDRRSDAVILDALIDQQPQSDLIPKVVNGLLGHRVRGRWGSTQENAFVLLALNRYFNTFEAQTPDFVARFWLGDTYAGEHAYSGRTTDRGATTLPMALLTQQADGTTTNLVVDKQGSGRLYYRLGLRYAPADLDLAALDRGFVVLRSYEGVDDPADVSQESDGTWRIRAGARVRVRLTLVADSQRTHVALIDPLPAGLEIVSPGLAVTQDAPADPGDPQAAYRGWWWWSWYDHQNLRDERLELFATYLWAGVYDYSYITRATTPGEFVVPPARAEEMYAPETFGRSASARVIVVP